MLMKGHQDKSNNIAIMHKIHLALVGLMNSKLQALSTLTWNQMIQPCLELH